VSKRYPAEFRRTVLDLIKIELFKPRVPWRTAKQVEIAVLEWVAWYDHRRLHEHCGDIPPAELETAHRCHTTDLAEAGSSTT
jgi:putative transposase